MTGTAGAIPLLAAHQIPKGGHQYPGRRRHADAFRGGIGKEVFAGGRWEHGISLVDDAIIPDFQCSSRDPASQGSLVAQGHFATRIEVANKRAALHGKVAVADPDQVLLAPRIEREIVLQGRGILDEDPGQRLIHTLQLDGGAIEGERLEEVISRPQGQGAAIAHGQALDLVTGLGGHRQLTATAGDSAVGFLAQRRAAVVGTVEIRRGAIGGESIVPCQAEPSDILPRDGADLVAPLTIVTVLGVVLVSTDGAKRQLVAAGTIDFWLVNFAKLRIGHVSTGRCLHTMMPLHHGREIGAGIDGIKGATHTAKQPQQAAENSSNPS